MLECVKKCAGRNLEKEVEIQMAYITCKDLTLGYEGHAIVSDLNFKVSKGDLYRWREWNGKKYAD